MFFFVILFQDKKLHLKISKNDMNLFLCTVYYRNIAITIYVGGEFQLDILVFLILGKPVKYLTRNQVAIF